MDKLSNRELTSIRRAAEDAIEAWNINHKPFIDVVAHPLNICTLVDMAKLSLTQQKQIDEMQAKVDACQKLLEKWKTTGLKGSSDYAVGGEHTRQECEDELEQALKGGEV